MNLYSHLQSAHEAFRLFKSLLRSFLGLESTPPDNQPTPIVFDVHIISDTGFFPPQPLARLTGPFDIWESALEKAKENLVLGDNAWDASRTQTGVEWRAQVASWSVISIDDLQNLRQQQRAHMVLAWILSFYMHSMPPSTTSDDIIIPRSIAVPLVAISNALRIAPILTFADTVLWNWELIDRTLPVTIDNMLFHTFSRTEDERNFYVTSARAELGGVEMLRIFNDYESLPNVTDLTSISKTAHDLNQLAGVINKLTENIKGVRSIVDPHVFYWEVRPWFEGSQSRGPDEPKWVYEDCAASDTVDLSGPSAGQSSVMHALDIFLDIDHKLNERRAPAPSSENKRSDTGFMERMRRYMPGKHRDYLTHLAASSRPIRALATQSPAIREPYDVAVMALKKLRDLHIRIACLYIVSMSRTMPPAGCGCPVSAMVEKLERERAADKFAPMGPSRGTGGNELALLLKAGRDATRRATISDN